MTQDVQPLTWQKRTNLEEHQQFFSKINEIIDNLAPTVEEAEAAIAQATQAVATANTASAAASAAASQAQTAASTVAGYDGRLTAAEDDIDTQGQQITVLQGRAGALETGMTALGTRMTAVEGREADYLKKAGAAQTVTSQIMVPTTATGLRDTQIANGTRIQNDLAAYEPMIRNTGNQLMEGIKRASNIQNGVGETYQGASVGTDWTRLGYMKVVNNGHPLVVLMIMCRNYSVGGRDEFFGMLAFSCSSTSSVKNPRWLFAGTSVSVSNFKLALKNDPELGYIAELWCKIPGTNNWGIQCSALMLDQDYQAWHGIRFDDAVAEPDWTSFIDVKDSTLEAIQ